MKKDSDANAGHARVLAETVAELEKVIDMTSEEEISSYASKKNDIISAKSDLEMHGDHLALGTELGVKLKKLRLERDEAMKKADGADSKVKNLEARIADHEEEIQSVKERSSYLEAQLRTVGVQLEEHKSVIKGREETAIQKAERAR